MKKKYVILIPIIILFVISLYYLPSNLKIKQLLWIIIALLLCILISKINLKHILRYSLFYYIILIILLVLLLVTNKYTNGSRAWFNIGFVSIQPSEFMKITLILFNLKYNKLNIWLFSIINILPMVLIFFEPDTGSVILLLIIYLYFLIKRLDKKKVFYLILLLIIILILTIIILVYNHDLLINIFGPSIIYRLDRINVFFSDNSIQSTNALLSIALSRLLYFPEMFNDFYISYILCNNIYLLIAIIICNIFILLLLLNKNTIISKIVFYIIFFQCFYNLSMNLKLVPVIGIPYLFVSYGGSHILSTMILIGLSINKDNNKLVLA